MTELIPILLVQEKKEYLDLYDGSPSDPNYMFLCNEKGEYVAVNVITNQVEFITSEFESAVRNYQDSKLPLDVYMLKI